MIPRMIRTAAETEVPMIPPILLKVSNLELIADAVAATRMVVIITILRQIKISELAFMSKINMNQMLKENDCIIRRVTQGEKSPNGHWTLARRYQSPGHQINRLE